MEVIILSYTILKKAQVAPNEYDIWIKAPQIATHAKAGQFVIVMADENSERIPLTIADTDEKEAIRVIYQVVGTSTEKLARLAEGDAISNCAGPLGKPSEIPRGKQTLVIGGGVGIAAILTIIKTLKEKGNHVTTILGSRDSEHLILEDEIRQIADETLVYTDDGSTGKKGMVTDGMKALFETGKQFDAAWAVGPTIMMKFCSLVAKEQDLLIWTSLNPIMIDGTGMCGGCRVKVKDTIKYACVDGPEFDGRYVDWDILMNRQKQYLKEESESKHVCKLGGINPSQSKEGES
ncbi:MAG: sulfide/dihydroorotate dehydrogenase-like FAD/NAD-binding protein [Thermotogota bacterium]|nr:sulfide/dihydroorotate dehydrogenase-like FAD/NAD-binding protein [Thermotogota bacterium]